MNLKKKLFFSFIKIFIIISSIIIISFSYILDIEYKSDKERLRKEIDLNSYYLQTRINEKLTDFIDLTSYIATNIGNHSLKELNGIDFSNFFKLNRSIDEIGFLNIDGMEIKKLKLVNLSEIIENREYKDLSRENIFTNIKNEKSGIALAIYTKPSYYYDNLNIGSIRSITHLYKDDKLIGYLYVDFNMNSILDILESSYKNIKADTYFISDNGLYLNYINKKASWGNYNDIDFDQKINIELLTEIKSLNKEKSGSKYLKNSELHYRPIHFIKNSYRLINKKLSYKYSNWLVYYAISNDYLDKIRYRRNRSYLYIYFSYFIFSLLLSYVLTKEIKLYYKEKINSENYYKLLNDKNTKLYQDSILHKDIDIYNIAYLKNILSKEFSKSLRHKISFSILVFELDHSENYELNKKLFIFKDLAELSKTVIRNEDILGMYGDDKFMLILPNINLMQTLVVAEKVRVLISKVLSLTISIGGANNIIGNPKNSDIMIDNALKMLFEAKKDGGDKIQIYRNIDI